MKLSLPSPLLPCLLSPLFPLTLLFTFFPFHLLLQPFSLSFSSLAYPLSSPAPSPSPSPSPSSPAPPPSPSPSPPSPAPPPSPSPPPPTPSPTPSPSQSPFPLLVTTSCETSHRLRLFGATPRDQARYPPTRTRPSHSGLSPLATSSAPSGLFQDQPSEWLEPQ